MTVKCQYCHQRAKVRLVVVDSGSAGIPVCEAHAYGAKIDYSAMIRDHMKRKAGEE